MTDGTIVFDYDEEAAEHFDKIYWFDEQQTLYKEQIAEALIAFNRIENFISDMIGTILNQAKREDLAAKTLSKLFMARVEALELLLLTVPSAPRLPIERLKNLAGARNNFAHGHFSADQNTGELIIMGKGKATPWDKEAIKPFLEECGAVRRDLNVVFAYIMFGDAPPNLPMDGYETSVDPQPSER